MQNIQQHKHEDYNQSLISGLYNQMRKIIDSSGQPVFIYLDDNHKLCNQRFADLLGYSSPQEWSNTPGFLEIFVDKASQNAFMTAYWSAINNMNASSTQLVLLKKDKSRVKASMVILPMVYEGKILSVHFIIDIQ